MHKIFYVLARLLILPLTACSIAVCAADACSDWKDASLTGDWGGARSSLCDKGITFELTHKPAKGGATKLAFSHAAHDESEFVKF